MTTPQTMELFPRTNGANKDTAPINATATCLNCQGQLPAWTFKCSNRPTEITDENPSAPLDCIADSGTDEQDDDDFQSIINVVIKVFSSVLLNVLPKKRREKKKT